MTTSTFSALPAEIHVNIAEHCKNTSLINLCLTSKRLNKRCLHVLYYHVHLRSNRDRSRTLANGKPSYTYLRRPQQCVLTLFQRQQQFVHTLLSHPEYGKHVKVFNITLCIPNSDDWPSLREYMGSGDELDNGSREELWRALQLLRNVKSVRIALEHAVFNNWGATKEQFPVVLFQSATSVRLVGKMQYRLAKSILDAINPAALKHLCIDMVEDRGLKRLGVIAPGARGEDGRIIARGVMSGLLTTLTGCCTALRTLILRRVGQSGDCYCFDAAADEASYVEWASFIHSVKGTVEKFTFDQAGFCLLCPDRRPGPALRIMHERFRQLVLPAILLGSWPCLTILELRGVLGDDQDEQAAPIIELEAFLGGNTKLVVEEKARFPYDFRETFRWD